MSQHEFKLPIIREVLILEEYNSCDSIFIYFYIMYCFNMCMVSKCTYTIDFLYKALVITTVTSILICLLLRRCMV